MKKIKEYLQNKPKLKKAIKLVLTFLIVLSFFFNFLIIGVASCSNMKKASAEVIREPVATMPVSKGLYKSDTCGIMSIDELARDYYYEQLLQYARTYVSANGDDTLGNHWSHMSNCSLSVSDWDHIGTPINDSDDFLVRYTGDSIDHTLFFISYSWVSTDNWDVYGFYLNKVTYGSTYMYYAYGIRYNYTGSDITQFPMTPFYSNTYIQRGLNIYIYHYYVESSDFAVVNPIYNALFTDTDPSEQNLGAAFNNGYDTGLKDGKSIGYDNGYQTGYEEGYVSGQVGGNNPFDIIASAFNSLTSILNIQLFPGITLSTIIFTPLIIILIIALFKLFRG